MIDPAIKAKWVAALRSGKFKQGQGHFYAIATDLDGRNHHRFCCLGVLLHIADDRPWVLDATYGRHNVADLDCERLQVYEVEDSQSTLCAFGLDHTEIAAMVTMNDVEKQSFHEIADYVERAH